RSPPACPLFVADRENRCRSLTGRRLSPLRRRPVAHLGPVSYLSTRPFHLTNTSRAARAPPPSLPSRLVQLVLQAQVGLDGGALLAGQRSAVDQHLGDVALEELVGQ